METLKSVGYVILIVMTLLGVVLIPIVGISMIYDANYCDNLSELNPERNFEWRLFGGCMLQTENGIWLSVDKITFLDSSINGSGK